MHKDMQTLCNMQQLHSDVSFTRTDSFTSWTLWTANCLDTLDISGTTCKCAGYNRAQLLRKFAPQAEPELPEAADCPLAGAFLGAAYGHLSWHSDF